MYQRDVICEIGCGHCCGYWRDVWDNAPEEQKTCTYQNPDGCALAREDRPWPCNSFQCEISIAYSARELTLAQAKKFIELGFFHNRHMWKPHLETKS